MRFPGSFFVVLPIMWTLGCSDGSDHSPVNTVVETTLGVATGSLAEEGVIEFLGLPYAEPPVAERRFVPPVAIGSWNGALDASEFGPACPQPAEAGTGQLYVNQSEDCLTLNVWTPAVDTRKRPVMVWIHGGGWIYEGTEDRLYRGAHLAARGDVVVVSMEYRLGVFGFSHLEGIPGSGNAGLLDQKLALQWVRDHIHAFGGDPGDVTIFGESAGGMSVTALMGMPAARGLFHKAIAQSGAGSTARSVEYARAVTDKLVSLAGVSSADDLQGLSMEELRAAQDSLIADAFIEDSLFGSVVDGTIFRQGPIGHHTV